MNINKTIHPQTDNSFAADGELLLIQLNIKGQNEV